VVVGIIAGSTADLETQASESELWLRVENLARQEAITLIARARLLNVGNRTHCNVQFGWSG
jgi:hypothetical protein